MVAEAGQGVYLDSLQLASGTLLLELLAPDGATVLTAESSPFASLDRGPLELTQTGTFTLIADGKDDDTPTYQFQLWDVPPPTVTTINLGDVADGAIETPGSVDHWQFQAEAGQGGDRE